MDRIRFTDFRPRSFLRPYGVNQLIHVLRSTRANDVSQRVTSRVRPHRTMGSVWLVLLDCATERKTFHLLSRLCAFDYELRCSTPAPPLI